MKEGRQKGGRCRCGGAPTCNVTPLCSMSVNAMFHKCLYNLFLNSKRLIKFLISNGKDFQNVWLRKNKDLLRLLMLVVVEAIFDTNERLSSTAKATISIITCKVVGHIYWNGLINNFMKEIHIIEIKLTE